MSDKDRDRQGHGLPRHLLEHDHVGDQAHRLGPEPAIPVERDAAVEPDHAVAPDAAAGSDAAVAPDAAAGSGAAEPRAASPAGASVPEGAVDHLAPVVESGRPIIERIGMAAIALVLASLFGGVALAAWSGGEVFLAAMGAIGCLMTLWVGALTLLRG